MDETAKNRKGLSVKRANLFYLCYIVLLLGLGGLNIPNIPRTWVAMLPYALTVILAVVLCKKEGLRLGDAFGFRRAKPLSLLLTVVLVIAMHEVSFLVSSLTNLLFPSFLQQGAETLQQGGFLGALIGVALIPAFFEEFVLRGGMVSSYRGTGRVRAAVLLSALLFGLMHMNATQLFYSFVMGIVLALLFILTDSIWPGVLFHLLNNGMSPVVGVIEERCGSEFVGRYIFPFSRGLGDPKSALITTASAVVGLCITIVCLRLIARHEGSEEQLRLFVKGGGGTQKLFTLPLVVAVVFLAVFTAVLCAAMFGAFGAAG